HGASVLRELASLRPGIKAFGAGGPRMRAAGFETLVRAEDVSVMGIAEVLPALPRILEAMDTLRDAARDRRPKAALLIDSPDFNLRLARRLRELKIPVAYFIGPSVWAWRTYRVRQIARDIQRMLVILPFEAPFYERHGVRATYVGNPLADRPALPAASDAPLGLVYKTSWLTWLIGRLLVRVKFVSLVNLLAGRALVPELLQSACTAGAIAAAAAPLLEEGTPARQAQIEGLRDIRNALASSE